MPKLLFYDLSTSQIKGTKTLLNKAGNKHVCTPLLLCFSHFSSDPNICFFVCFFIF